MNKKNNKTVEKNLNQKINGSLKKNKLNLKKKKLKICVKIVEN